MKYSFVVYTYGDKRLYNLKHTLYTANKYRDDEFEYILIEHGESYSEELANTYNFIYFNIPNAVNSISAARNMGVEKSTGEYIVLHDNDLLVGPSFFHSIKLAANKYRYFSNFSTVINLTPELTNKVYNNIDNYRFTNNELNKCKKRLHQGGISNADGGSLTIRRDDYLAIGGYDEMFVEWGAEDNDFRIRMLLHLELKYVGVLNQTLYHTWHEHSSPSHRGYSINSKIYYKRLDRYAMNILKGDL